MPCVISDRYHRSDKTLISLPAQKAPATSGGSFLYVRTLFCTVEVVDPIDGVIVDQEYDRAEGPCDRINPIYDGDRTRHRHENRKNGHADHTPAGKHDEHRHRRFSRAAEHGRYAVRVREQAEEERCDVSAVGAVGYDLRLVIECRDKLGRPHERHKADKLGYRHRADDAEACSASYTGIFLSADVLPDKGCQCHCEACDRQEGKAFYLGVSAAACHCHAAEGIYI